MGKTLLSVMVAALIVLGTVPVFAGEAVHNTLNAAVDMPNLVKFTDTLSLGVEGTKGVASNLFYDSFAGIEDDQNYQIYAKLTYTGSLINFSKK